ncbi:MAG: hypothetical protein ACREBR_04790 [bacterium]
MKQSMLVLLAVVLGSVLVAQEFHLWNTGLKEGEQRYKQSHRMYMTLKSAYHYGYMDGHDGKREDWDGDDQ